MSVSRGGRLLLLVGMMLWPVLAAADDLGYLVKKSGALDQELPLSFNTPGAFLYRYDLDPAIVGPAVYGQDFVFLDPQAQTTVNRIRIRVTASKPLPRAPIPRTTLPAEVLQFYATRANLVLPPGSLPHEMFEFFAKGVVGEKWERGQVLEKFLPARYNVAGLGYHVDRVFNGPQDFQAVGLTADTWFRLRIDRLTPDGISLLERRFMYVYIHDLDRPPVLAIRGTELKEGDILTDGNPKGVGFDQFLTNGASLEQWLREVSEPFKLASDPNLRAIRYKPHVTGHSLGGALTQWVTASYTNSGGRLGQIVTFNPAGISRDAGGFGASYFRRENVDSVTHYIVSGDPVSMGGETFLPPAALGNLGQPGWVLFSYRKTSDVTQLRKHSIPFLIDERLMGGEWIVNPIKNPNPLAPPSVAVFQTPEGTLNDPYFTFLPDPDYFGFLEGIARAGGGSLAAAAVYRYSAEAFRADLGKLMLTVVGAADVIRGATLWNSTAWTAILKMTQKKLDKPQSNLNKAGTASVAASSASGELGFWDASPVWHPQAWDSSQYWGCGWDKMSSVWGPDQWNLTIPFNDVAWKNTEKWDCELDWPIAGRGTGDPNDKTPPSCLLTALPGEPITGPVTFTVQAFDERSKISRVVLKIDRQPVGEIVGTRSDDRYAFNWTPPSNAKSLSVVDAFCYDNGAPPNEKNDFRIMSVNTQGVQDGPPKLNFLNVVQGQPWLTPIPRIKVKATDSQGVVVQLNVQGSASGGLNVCTAPDCNCGPDCFAFDWQPGGGRYALTAVGIEATGTARLVSNLRADNVLIDAAAPSVSFSTPAANESVDRRIPVVLSASDDLGVAQVAVHAQSAGDPGYKVLWSVSQPPYSFKWCPTRAGVTSLKAIASDVAGRTRESVIQVQVPPSLVCTNPATFSVSSPSPGAKLKGGVSLRVSGTSASVTRVEFAIRALDGSGTEVKLVADVKDASGAFTTSWDTNQVKNGGYRITVTALESGLARDSERMDVTVDNPPPVVIPPPTIDPVRFPGMYRGRVTGSIPVSFEARAYAGRTISRVDIYVDSALQGAPHQTPLAPGMYYWVWHTAQFAKGPHRLEIKATDNEGRSSSKTFDVIVESVKGPTITYQASDAGWCGVWEELDRPEARSYHSMVGTPGRVFLFGGLSKGRFTNELWSFDGVRWTDLTPPFRRAGVDWPNAVAKSVMAYDPFRKRVVLGGDWPYLWEMDMNGAFTKISAAIKLNPTRDPSTANWSMAYDETSRKVVIHGNSYAREYFAWEWDGVRVQGRAGLNKNEFELRGDPPYEVMFYLRDALHVFSNRTFMSRDPYNHDSYTRIIHWKWQPSFNFATEYAFNGVTPALNGLAVASDPGDGGGVFALVDGVLKWISNHPAGETWQVLSSGRGPSARKYHALAWDEGRGELVFFGGQINGTGQPDTWTYKRGRTTCPVYKYEEDDTNDPPTLLLAPQGGRVTPGMQVTFAVNATDPDGDALMLSAQGLPAGATFKPVSGAGSVSQTFSWLVGLPPGAQSDDVEIVFTAVDAWGKSSARNVLYMVCQNPKSCGPTVGPLIK